jgi:HD-GYP domain-containing protein (c-di-GMP phosphodiesterase class II)
MKIKIPSSKLNVGMFVSDLDRSWAETPFLPQGFLIENNQQIKQLQQHCEFVIVDWDNSARGLQTSKPAIRKAEPVKYDSKTPPPANVTRPPDVVNQTTETTGVKHSIDEPITKESDTVQTSSAQPTGNNVQTQTESTPPIATGVTLQNISKYLQATPETQIKAELPATPVAPPSTLPGKLKGLFKFKSDSANKSDIKKPLPASDQNRATPEAQIANIKRPNFVPANVTLTAYNDTTPVADEIAPADAAYMLAGQALDELAQDIRSNKKLEIVKVEDAIQDVVGSMTRNPDALMLVMQLRQQDNARYGYALQSSVYLVALGRHMGLPTNLLERLGITGLLLDIGNMKLPGELLQKKSRLTPEDFEIIKSHVQLGLEILKETPNLHADILDGVAQHHEREDGSGYPAGISGNNISLFGRMAAIVQSFTALTNTRSHTKAVSAHEALKSISALSGEYYLDSLVEQFIQTIGIFPVGSLVELSTGEVAIIIGQNKLRRLKPRVLIVRDSNKNPVSHPTTLDLLWQQETSTAIHILRGLPTGAFNIDVREYQLA